MQIHIETYLSASICMKRRVQNASLRVQCAQEAANGVSTANVLKLTTVHHFAYIHGYIARDSLILCLVHTHSRKSSPSGKAASEDVPMEDNPAYGVVNVSDTVKRPEEN